MGKLSLKLVMGDCPSSPRGEQLSENQELRKMNLRMNTKKFSNYNVFHYTAQSINAKIIFKLIKMPRTTT